jgi:tRNA 2-thiouridine synthesizing protein B
MLHLIFQTPLDAAVLGRVAAGDEVVFLDNAVLGLLRQGRWANPISALSVNAKLFVLADDLQVRGIAETELADGLTLLDYAGLVGLTVKNPTIQSWA